MCKKPTGCNIQSLAEDQEITNICDAFIDARPLLGSEIYRNLGLEKLKEAGIIDTSLILELESRLKNYLDKEKEKKQSKEHVNKQIKKR